jgi:hypothetical protein
VLWHQSLDVYFIGRVLPYAIVAGGLSGFGIPATDANVVLGFRLLHAVELLAAVWALGRFCERMGVSARGYAIAVAGLLLSVFVCK